MASEEIKEPKDILTQENFPEIYDAEVHNKIKDELTKKYPGLA